MDNPNSRYSYQSPRPPADLRFDSRGGQHVGGSAGLLVTDEKTGFAVFVPPRISQHKGRLMAIALLELADDATTTKESGQ